MNLLVILFACVESASRSAELKKVQQLFDFEYSDNGLLNDMVNLKGVRLSKQLFLETQNSAHFVKLYEAFKSHYGVDYNQLDYGNLTEFDEIPEEAICLHFLQKRAWQNSNKTWQNSGFDKTLTKT